MDARENEVKMYQEPSDKGKWDMICPRCKTKYYSGSQWHQIKTKDGRYMCEYYGCRSDNTKLEPIQKELAGRE